jgi:hypothetical protein
VVELLGGVATLDLRGFPLRGFDRGGLMSEARAIDLRTGEDKALAGRDGQRSGLNATHWRPCEKISFAQWVGQGRKLGLVGRSVGWWIGDWVHYGNVAYGERYVRAARITGLDVQTLMNMVYVASRFAPARRRERLSWSHHAEVAALESDDQERWLDRAEADRLSVRCLREEIRRERRAALSVGEQATVVRLDPGSEPGDSIVCPSCGHSFPESDRQEMSMLSDHTGAARRA